VAAGPASFSLARFRFPWRPYQARVLEALDRHLADDHLHVIAPPGSGKTVLGLETLRRLARPALVLAPTSTIREQWIERLRVDFSLPGGEPSISRSALEPGELTFLTYQALYQVFRGRQEQDFVAALQAAGVGVIAADEAHHLRSEWWRCLDQVKRSLPGVKTLCLTATPPYDAPTREWHRYAHFAGEVDEEIGVPELVRDGSLCPHQDLLILFAPDSERQQELQDFSRRSAALPGALALDDRLVESLASAPATRSPDQHLGEIAQHAAFWLAVAVYLGNIRWEAARNLVAAMDLGGVRLPAFDLRWSQVLLRGLLLDRLCPIPDDLLEHWQRSLERIGALEGRRIELLRHPRRQHLLGSAAGMIDATAAIVDAEKAHFGESLRLVVLSDHVRAADFPAAGDAAMSPLRLGVVPVFERLRRLRLPGVIPAVLSGSLVVLPATAWPAFAVLLAERGEDAQTLARTALPHAPDFLRIEPGTRARQAVVAAVTELFTRGEINLLCGTSALLGEGWDAPAINSLVLASTVSAHVSSNQLRGRAIRSQSGNPGKCSNIWHLCGVQTLSDTGQHDGSPGAAAPPQMEARFLGFVGLRTDEDRLESGLQRLGTCRDSMTADEVTAWNSGMFALAGRVHALPERWRRAIGSDRLDRGRLLRELRLPARQFAQASHWQVGHSLTRLLDLPLQGLAGLPIFAALQRLLVRRRIRHLAEAVAAAMIDAGTLPRGSQPSVVQDGDDCRVLLAGVDYMLEHRFVATVAELFDPLADPRYLIRHRRSAFAVPQAFGQRKAEAERFLEFWAARVGPGELVYTRSQDGRLALLRAKEALLLHVPDWRIEQRAVWVTKA